MFALASFFTTLASNSCTELLLLRKSMVSYVFVVCFCERFLLYIIMFASLSFDYVRLFIGFLINNITYLIIFLQAYLWRNRRGTSGSDLWTIENDHATAALRGTRRTCDGDLERTSSVCISLCYSVH